MTQSRNPILKPATTLILGAISCLWTPAQTQPAPQPQPPTAPTPAAPTLPKPVPAFYRNLIVIDPAHGGTDTGAHLNGSLAEKDFTLAFAAKLRPLLTAAGFTVISTRESDPADILPTDQRAGIANHDRPLACILIHASTSGSGIHIATSSLTIPDDPAAAARGPQPWNTAQAPIIPASLRLANEIGLALVSNKLPVVLLRASTPPIDNLTCAAVAIEIAPLTPANGQPTPVTDASYQQHIAESIAAGLTSYRTHNAPPPSAITPSTAGAAR